MDVRRSKIKTGAIKAPVQQTKVTVKVTAPAPKKRQRRRRKAKPKPRATLLFEGPTSYQTGYNLYSTLLRDAATRTGALPAAAVPRAAPTVTVPRATPTAPPAPTTVRVPRVPRPPAGPAPARPYGRPGWPEPSRFPELERVEERVQGMRRRSAQIQQAVQGLSGIIPPDIPSSRDDYDVNRRIQELSSSAGLTPRRPPRRRLSGDFEGGGGASEGFIVPGSDLELTAPMTRPKPTGRTPAFVRQGLQRAEQAARAADERLERRMFTTP